jgi:hypothetical protein
MTTYDQAVAEFRQLDEEIESDQWRQADIAAELYRAGASQVQIADDVHKSQQHISLLCRMSERYTSSSKPEFSSAYAEMKEGPDWEEKQAIRRAKSALAKLPPRQRVEVMENASDELPPEQQAELVDRWLENAPLSGPSLTPDERQRVQDGTKDTERTAREIDLGKQQTREQIVGGKELLADVVEARNRLDTVVTKWGRRSINLFPAEVEVLAIEVAAMHRAADQIAQFRHGREDMDDEWQRLNEGAR